MTENIHDLVIIGGGPTGLAAAIYAARAEMKTLILERMIPGGQVQNTMEIENYPGFAEVSGYELSEKFHQHALKFGAQVEMINVSAVSTENGIIKLTTDSGDIYGRAALVATGAKARFLNVPGEAHYRDIGGGVSYCAVCDGAFYKERDVMVIGGGDSAVEEAIYLTKFAKSVKIVHRRDELRAAKILQERARTNEKISFEWNSVVEEIVGDDKHVNGIRLKSTIDGTIRDIPCYGVFIYVGMSPNTQFVQGIIDLDSDGFVKTNEHLMTTMPGLFAAGDVRSGAWRQIITAVADGALSVKYIEEYLNK